MIYSEKINIGVSACTYGCKVRYNGKGWSLVDRIGREKEIFTFHIYCPEVMAGLGIPRNPIRLKGGNGQDFWEGNADIYQQGRGTRSNEMRRSVDYVMDAIERDNIKAYIYFEGSPSCGVTRTTSKNRRMGKPPGVLGYRLIEKGLFLIPAQDLQSPIKWWDWRRRLLAFVWLDSQIIETPAEMYSVWHEMKFLCQELDEKRAREIGKEIADKKIIDFESYKDEMMGILRKPSTPAKIKQWMWKNYSYMRKHHDIDLPEILEPTTPRGSTHLAKEMLRLEVELVKKGLNFSSSPVVFRRDR